MDDVYLTLAEPVTASIEVKRSVFRCDLSPVADEGAAREAVERARKLYWDARHHCSAFVLGPGSDVRRSSDDGEPSGTAGMPMLDVMMGAGVTNVVAVVTRWFGGTLLGTGGLVKAYGDATREALSAARFDRYEHMHVLRVGISPAHIGRVEHALRAEGLAVVGVEYGAGDAQLEIGVPQDAVSRAESLLAELTGGDRTFEDVGRSWTKV